MPLCSSVPDLPRHVEVGTPCQPTTSISSRSSLRGFDGTVVQIVHHFFRDRSISMAVLARAASMAVLARAAAFMSIRHSPSTS